ncbi:hypothetical protein B0H19DRAFT_404613 [Mycena capillaripes]|nr:hypothetical protein B0H19DRAFT_404613 [Mycena capillaripes]
MLLVMIGSIILPWLQLRKVAVRSEVLSKHAVRLQDAEAREFRATGSTSTEGLAWLRDHSRAPRKRLLPCYFEGRGLDKCQNYGTSIDHLGSRCSLLWRASYRSVIQTGCVRCHWKWNRTLCPLHS